MTRFNIRINDQIPHHIYAEVDRRFDVAIERTLEGLSIRVYPRTHGERWDVPFKALEVNEAELVSLEAATEESA